MKKSMIAAALMLALGSPLPAAAVPATAIAPAEPVRIGFAPPLGEDLRFRITRTRVPAARGQAPTALDFTARFSRAGDGYLMAVQFHLPAALESARGHPALILLLRPLVLRLDEVGDIVGMEDEKAFWDGVRLALADFVRSEGGPPEGQAMINQIVDRMQAMPDAARLEKISESVRPIIAGAGMVLTPRAPARYEAVTETLAGPMPMQTSISLERVEGDIATIAFASSVPGEALLAGTRDLVARVAAASGMPIPAIPADMRFLAVEHRESVAVSVESGISRRYESVRTIRSGGSEGEQTVEQRVVVERID